MINGFEIFYRLFDVLFYQIFRFILSFREFFLRLSNGGGEAFFCAL